MKIKIKISLKLLVIELVAFFLESTNDASDIGINNGFEISTFEILFKFLLKVNMDWISLLLSFFFIFKLFTTCLFLKLAILNVYVIYTVYYVFPSKQKLMCTIKQTMDVLINWIFL